MAARALRTPTFRQRRVRPKKGRGSYSRVKRPLNSFL
ncbi:MAG: ribosome alternative rescue factor ArfA [Alphaproteobacteria bacterium]|nr:ribosome alternative rescue factor ArfA [Alphaproteobacteria bacterium]